MKIISLSPLAALTAALLVSPTLLTGQETPPVPAPEAAPDRPPIGKNTALLKIELKGKVYYVDIRLFPEDAPQTVANFKKLVDDGFYKGIAVHRVLPNYLVQLGDPLTKKKKRKPDWGTGGPGYTLPPEIKRYHIRSAVAAARLSDSVNPGKESNGSQFYVMLVDAHALDSNYTVFGQVTRGMEVFDAMSKLTLDTNDVPTDRIEIRSAKIVTTDTHKPPKEPQIVQSGIVKKDRPGKPKSSKSTNATEKEPGFFGKVLRRIW